MQIIVICPLIFVSVAHLYTDLNFLLILPTYITSLVFYQNIIIYWDSYYNLIFVFIIQ